MKYLENKKHDTLNNSNIKKSFKDGEVLKSLIYLVNFHSVSSSIFTSTATCQKSVALHPFNVSTILEINLNELK